MDGFSAVLMKNYSGKLDARGLDYLRRVQAAARRMGDLIEDMLNLSRISRQDMRRVKVDLSKIARSLAADFRMTHPERNVDFVIAPEIEANGDPHLLGLALENLLNNAWKFTGRNPSARIEFGLSQQEGRRVYFVKDDGAGFDMAYAGKLFAPFQRLHSEREFEGTGIGLATVRRIIARHGGSIWAEGEIGKGATFIFHS